MFVSVKERARQIANGQFSVAPASAPVTSLIDLTPGSNPTTIATAKKSLKDAPPKAISQQSCPPNSKSSKVIPQMDTVPKTAPSKPTPTPSTASKITSSNITSPPEVNTPIKSPTKPKFSNEPSSKPSSPKIGSSKPTPSSRSITQAKAPSTPKLASPTKATAAAKSTSSKRSSSKPKHSKLPSKRVDSPIESDDDPLSSLRSACLKQVSGVTGLGGRRLAIVLKQRSSGEWYAALKDTGSDKYLKMWMNKEKTFATKERALEAYLVFVTKARNEVRWFPMSPRASSPKAKGK